ncbi:hypothetical protein [Streptomyces lydicus]|uniref:hypothetical protein n=1 Tax=Streptomyces lydicus TaxID=47763 RepID=UPI003D69A5D1
MLDLAASHQETRVGDIPHIVRCYLKAAPNEKVTADQVSAAHPAVASGVQHIVDEYEYEYEGEYENGNPSRLSWPTPALVPVRGPAATRVGAEDFFPSTR